MKTFDDVINWLVTFSAVDDPQELLEALREEDIYKLRDTMRELWPERPPA